MAVQIHSPSPLMMSVLIVRPASQSATMSQPNFDMQTPPRTQRKYGFVNLTPDHYSSASSSISSPPSSHSTSIGTQSSRAPSSHATSSRASSIHAPSSTTGSSSDSDGTLMDIVDGIPLRSAALSAAHVRQPSPYDTLFQSESTPSSPRADKGDSFARGLLDRKHTTELKQLFERHDSEVRELAEDVQGYGESKAETLGVGTGIPMKAEGPRVVRAGSKSSGRILAWVVMLVLAALLGMFGAELARTHGVILEGLAL